MCRHFVLRLFKLNTIPVCHYICWLEKVYKLLVFIFKIDSVKRALLVKNFRYYGVAHSIYHGIAIKVFLLPPDLLEVEDNTKLLKP